MVERTDDGELCLMVRSLTVLLSNLHRDTLPAFDAIAEEEDDNEDVRISNSLSSAIVIVLFLEFRRVTGCSLARGHHLCCHWHQSNDIPHLNGITP